MDDEDLIGYCELHSSTERAMFSKDQINRMIALAGFPEDFPKEVHLPWYSVHGEMKELCKLARERMNK